MIYTGKSVLKGIAIGNIYVYRNEEYRLVKKAVADPQEEIQRVLKAVEEAKEQLAALYEEAVQSVGEEQAMIFDMHKMMLEDAGYLNAIRNRITEESVNGEYAVTMAGNAYSEMFAAMEDNPYMQARAADIQDISQRIIRILAGISDQAIESAEPVILVAEDLTPSETVRLDKSKILAFVTVGGSANSHTAILARSMNLPSLVGTGIELSDELHGKPAIVDGYKGEFIVEPENTLVTEMEAARNRWMAERAALEELKGKENRTTDGRTINLYANIGSVQDVEKVLEADAGGIGLFRSEFLYLGRDSYPTEEEQFAAYREVLTRMEGKKVIIRTLDIGADKQADYFELEKEENPAMGYRAIRICLERKEIFKEQLRAIYRASAFGCGAIMFPMIISANEIREAKKVVEEVKQELAREGHQIGTVETGVMIETPAAALVSDELAEEVDFFSIGTNDLSQYTLAIDRQNQKLDGLYDPHHPAIMKLIRMTVENAHKAGIWAGICGELAADTEMTETFIDMGVDELSVSPGHILELRKVIREI